MVAKRIPLAEWEWWWEFNFERPYSRNTFREIRWLIRHGVWMISRNTRPLIFGAGRIWYDGPIWFLHIGWLSISLSTS